SSAARASPLRWLPEGSRASRRSIPDCVSGRSSRCYNTRPRKSASGLKGAGHKSRRPDGDFPGDGVARLGFIVLVALQVAVFVAVAPIGAVVDDRGFGREKSVDVVV